MAEPNILLTRIDSRLIHGQVVTGWLPFLGANLILVANDKVASDEVQQQLLDISVNSAAQTRYFSIQKTIEVIHKAASSQKIFIIVENVEDALKLVEGGVPIKQLNVGNMHFSEGKKQITSVISVDDHDITCFKKLLELQVKIDTRRVPSDSIKSIQDLINS
ncbi:PTS galactosamine transporter subunit IIB [Rickettsiales bacterium LUAb2]